MNKLLRPLCALAAFAAATSGLPAQPEVKLVVIDMNRVFEEHYESVEANAKLQDVYKKAQEQAEELNKQRATMVESYKELDEQAKNTLLTAEARAKAGLEVQKKQEEIQRKSAELQNFVQNSQQMLQRRVETHREMLLEKISKHIAEIAKRHGATLVLDKSGLSGNRIPVILYSDAAYDITDEVIREENKNRPPAAAPAATAPGAAASPAPFTVPGATAPKAAAPETKK